MIKTRSDVHGKSDIAEDLAHRDRLRTAWSLISMHGYCNPDTRTIDIPIDKWDAAIDMIDEVNAAGTQAVDGSSDPDSALDAQAGGDHYKKLGDYQPWQVMNKWLTPEELKGFVKGTVIAYLAREDDKGGRLDIEKAKHTMEIYLELTEGE